MGHFLPTGTLDTRTTTIWTIVTLTKEILSSVLKAKMTSLIKEIFFRLELRRELHLFAWINIIYLIIVSVEFFKRIWIFRGVFNIAPGQNRKIRRIWVSPKINRLRWDRKVEGRNWWLPKKWIMMVGVWSISNVLPAKRKLSPQQNLRKRNWAHKLSLNSTKVQFYLSRNPDKNITSK